MPQDRNIKLVIAYDGTDFNGWQKQKHDITIQGEIEKCLATMTTTEVVLHGAGRTDAGVHADGMVANFHTNSKISCSDFTKGLNSMLPSAIRIYHAEDVGTEFHSRFSARGKHYEYRICVARVMPPTERLYQLHVPQELDYRSIRESLNHIIGTHDFSSFENSGSRDKDKVSRKGPIRNISFAQLEQLGEVSYAITIIGEGFLRHMVRNIVGTVLEVGKGMRSSGEFARILAAKDRSAGGPTAPAHGLKLKKVLY